jgi:putative ABC transport system permease protein
MVLSAVMIGAKMRRADTLQFSLQALLRQRFRSVMALLSVAIGVTAVLVLTAMGEGARGYITNEFSHLGKDILVMFPGRRETTGGMPPLMGASARDITLDDAAQLQHRVGAISELAPLVIGSAEISHHSLSREVTILGSNGTFLRIRNLKLAEGKNFTDKDFRSASNECIIGQTIKEELFGNEPALGEWIRIGSYRLRVVGILDGRADSFGMNLSDAVIIPVAVAQQLFNVNGLFRVMMKISPDYSMVTAKTRILNVMNDIHQVEDVTINSPDAILATFSSILIVLTLGIGAIGMVSLAVAGILIMNITLINVSQRVEEIGLLKALGGSAKNIQSIFLTESILLVALGTVIGVIVGEIIVWLACLFVPSVPFHTPLWAMLFAIVVSMLAGLGFAWGPAMRASQFTPVKALQGQR